MKDITEIETHLAVLIEDITFGVTPASGICRTDRLMADLGLDSLDYATVLLSCERWLGVRVREDGADWTRLQTVGQLAEFLQAHVKAHGATR